jgi:hypothetical protein
VWELSRLYTVLHERRGWVDNKEEKQTTATAAAKTKSLVYAHIFVTLE